MADDELTAADWMGVAIVVAGVGICWLFPLLIAPRFAQMFRDFGNASLPRITQLGLTAWFPPLLGAVPLALLLVGVAVRMPLGKRRAAIVGSFVLAAGAIGACIGSMYAPIFELAGKIQ
jgi:type II secretory pathway component PulF